MVKGVEPLAGITDARIAVFVDLDEDGTLDVMVQRTGEQGAGRVLFVQNNFYYDAFFMKAIRTQRFSLYILLSVLSDLLASQMGAVLNGACSSGWCQPENDSLPRYPVHFFLITSFRGTSNHAYVSHTALRRQHLRRKLQIHDPRHVGSALGRASPAAPADVVPSAEHAVRVLRARADEQLHRESVRGRGARTRRRARDGHSQLEARDQSGRGGGRVAQGAVPSPWAVDPLGRLDGRGYRDDGCARWGRACAASEREGAVFAFLWMMSLAADSSLFFLSFLCGFFRGLAGGRAGAAARIASHQFRRTIMTYINSSLSCIVGVPFVCVQGG
jgi:hypothetical protein